MFKTWAVVYRGFASTRFAKYSRGGGDWPPLKSREGSILRKTGLLFNALQPAFPGNGGLAIRAGLSIVVGYGGAAKHGKGKAKIADIAEFHQLGGPRLPQRKIIVQPDVETFRQLATVATEHFGAHLNE